MIKLTKKLEYSLMILKYIEDNGQIGPISARQVCDHLRLPFDPVAKVMQLLKNHEILSADKGSKGGYTLSSNLTNISYFELIKIIENIGEQDFCDSKQCTLKANCNIVSPIRDLQVMTNDFFKKININELLNGNLI